jgi:hypothetical protein
MIKRGTSSSDIGIGGIATPPKANHHFGSESAPIKNRHKKEDGNTPNFSNSLQLGNRRPNRLPIIHHQQQSNISNNNENGGNSNSILRCIFMLIDFTLEMLMSLPGFYFPFIFFKC